MNIHRVVEQSNVVWCGVAWRGMVHGGFLVANPVSALGRRNYALLNANCELHKQQASQYRS